MDEIRFETGVKTYTINDSGATVSFNPADANFAHKLYNVLDTLTKMQETKEPENLKPDALWELMVTRDIEVRSQIDSLFGEGKSDEIFPDVSVLSLADGLPLWANFLIAITAEMDDSITAQAQKADKRVEMLNNKYGKYMAKYGKKA